MKKSYALLALLVGWLGGTQVAQAQYSLTTAPYKQNFDGLANQNYGGTAGNVQCTGGHLVSPAEVYAQATFPNTTLTSYSPATISANDGSNSDASYYHFGYASDTDRAFGGIAGTSYVAAGIGYVGIRLKNTTGTTIRNLEVQYAMEQWYNSGRQDAAKLSVSYQTGSSVTSLLSGTWTDVPALGVDAPSTATVISNRDGNSAANRRLVSTTITDLNLAAGQEIMLRWGYTLNSDTNGNGLSIDDVVITPETGIFYSQTTGDLTKLATWGSNSDGSGTAPTSFTAANQVFYVMSAAPSSPAVTADAVDRITGAATWTVSGANSKIIVGTASAPASMRVEYNKNINGTIDVSPGSYFLHRRTAANGAIGFTLGTLASTSTVDYNSDGTMHTIQAVQYGNLRVSGTNSSRATNAKKLAATTVVTGMLTLNSGSDLELGDYDLTVLGAQNISGYTSSTYVVTNGKGRLRVQVPRASSSSAGTVVTFPVGPSHTAYTPMTLQQTSTNSDDVFEVRVLDNVYETYNATTYAPTGAQATKQVVNKTWLVSKEVPDNATNVTMTAQWSGSDMSSDFTVAKAHINHYTNGAWDKYQAELGITGSGPYVAKRSGITSFSPFGVSSRTDGTLPVQLTAFAAQREGTAVRCAWTTASEANSRHFVVERSLDGVAFAALGTVAAAGSSASTRTYAFLDTRPVASWAYYRLRQVDLDGTESFSPVVAVADNADGGAAAAATVFPNPSTGALTLSATADITSFEVLNALGQVVQSATSLDPARTQQASLDGQPAGLYLVRLRTSQGTHIVRLLKQQP